MDPQPEAPGPLEFDISRGVEMAGLAFNAYCEPKPVHAFEDYETQETTVLVLDKDFLALAFSHVLEVQLLRAHNLPDGAPGELLDAPNTYAVVSMVSPETALEARTRPYKLTSKDVSHNPIWDDALPAMLFPVRNKDTDLLHIELYDAAPGNTWQNWFWSKTQLLGCTALQLGQLQVGGGMVEMQLPLRVPDCSIAVHARPPSVIVQCRLRPMADCDEHVRKAMTTVKTMPMSWDAPTEIGLRFIEWLRRWAYRRVTWSYLIDVMRQAGAAIGELQPLAFIENRRTRTEAWVFCNKGDRRVVVAFRGTNELPDWSINLRALPVPDDPIRPRTVPAPGGIDATKIRVHHGFLEGYKSVRKAVTELVDEVLRLDGGQQSWKVEVTGHSLGGALATLAAYDLAWTKHDRDLRQQARPAIGSVSMITFGQPRVGNKVFAHDFNEILPDAWRFHNINDCVTSVPFPIRTWSFMHVGKDVYMSWFSGRPKCSLTEQERWLLLKLLWTNFISSHLEFRYQATFLRMVRRWIQDREQPQNGN